MWEKKNIKFKNQNLVEYSPVTTLLFEPSMSVGNESELVTFVNVPVLVIYAHNKLGKFFFKDTFVF